MCGCQGAGLFWIRHVFLAAGGAGGAACTHAQMGSFPLSLLEDHELCQVVHFPPKEKRSLSQAPVAVEDSSTIWRGLSCSLQNLAEACSFPLPPAYCTIAVCRPRFLSQRVAHTQSLEP